MGRNARNAMVMVFALACSATSQAQDMSTPLTKLPNEIEYKGLAAAPQTAVLFGDPSKPGIYVVRVRFPKGTTAPLPQLRNQKPTWANAAAVARSWKLSKLAERLDALVEA